MIAIIGAGLTGLSAAYYLRGDVCVMEKESVPGGLSRTLRHGSSAYDFGGHWLHLRHDWTKELVGQTLGIPLRAHSREARIRLDGKFGRYPFQNNLRGYSPDIVYDCIAGLIEARYQPRREPETFADYIELSMGKGIARHFMTPYNTKLWGTAPENMSVDWMGRFVPTPDVEKALKSIIYPDTANAQGYNEHFFYPEHGGIGVLPERLAAAVGGIQYNREVRTIDLARRTLTFQDGGSLCYSRLINTMPLVELVRRTVDLPDAVRQAAELLNWTDITVFNLTVSHYRQNFNWVYFPEPEFPFFRQGNYTTVDPEFAPAGCQSLYIEVSQRLDRNPQLPKPEEILTALKKIGAAGERSEIVEHLVTPLPFSYVVYDRNHRSVVPQIRNYFESQGVYSIGRYGAWEYSSMEDAIVAGRRCAEEIIG